MHAGRFNIFCIDPHTVPDVMERLLAGIRSEMQSHDAPLEAFVRLDLPGWRKSRPGFRKICKNYLGR